MDDHTITVRRMDPVMHMARFYTLRLQAELAGGCALIREWGRVGRPGQVRVNRYDTPAEALSAGITLIRSKVRRGYRQI